MSELMAQTAPADSKSAVPPITIRRAPGIGGFASQNVPIPDPNTLLLMHFDSGNGSTLFVDSSSYANAANSVNSYFGAISTPGGTQTTAQAKFGVSSFLNNNNAADGGNAFNNVQIPITAGGALDLTRLSSWTIEFWYYPTSVTDGDAIFSFAYNNATPSPLFVVLVDNSGDMFINPNPSSGFPASGLATSLVANVWQHIAIVYDGANLNTYLNGVFQLSAAVVGPIYQPPLLATGYGLYLGQGPFSGGPKTQSYLDEFRISNGALYTTNFTPQTAPFVAASGGTSLAYLPVRGINKMQGVVYTVIGATLYTLADDGNDTGTLTAIATGILGEGFVRMTNNTACLVILIPGTKICYTYSLVGGFQLLTAPGFTDFGAIDCNFCDSYIVFLALNGREFFNDDGQIVSGQGQITFNSGSVFPREFGTDLFVGMAVDHREVLLLGQLTSEGYLNAGNAVGDPFNSAPDSFIELGALPGTAYCIANQDQSVFWVANDKTVRRRNGQTPQRVSNSGIEAILEHADFTGSYALTPSVGGHATWALMLPAL